MSTADSCFAAGCRRSWSLGILATVATFPLSGVGDYVCPSAKFLCSDTAFVCSFCMEFTFFRMILGVCSCHYNFLPAHHFLLEGKPKLKNA